MRNRWTYLCLALVVLSSAACKSQDEKSSTPIDESAAEAVAEAEEVEPNQAGALERGTSFGKSLLARGRSTSEELADQGREALRQTRAWGTDSLDTVHSEAVEIARSANGDMDEASQKVNAVIAVLAMDPSDSISAADRLARMMILMVPVVGPAKRYIDARMLFEAGVKNSNPEQQQEARRELLITFAEAGLDIGMLGVVGSRLDVVATGADHVLKVLKLSRMATTLAGTNLKTFDTLLDTLLLNPQIRASADSALTVRPSKIEL